MGMPTILVIDDDPAIRMMFSRTLKSLGEVEEANGGVEALRLLGAKKYDLILLDLHMPVVDGLMVLQMMSNKPGPNNETPIYICTADTSDEVRLRAFRRRGAVFFLTKPVNLIALQTLASATLTRQDQRTTQKQKRGGR